MGDPAASHRPCVTAPNATGARCTCDYACANYWLRAQGHRAEDQLRRAYLGRGDQLGALEAEAYAHEPARPRVGGTVRAGLARVGRALTRALGPPSSRA